MDAGHLKAAFAHWGVKVERRLAGGHRNDVFLVQKGQVSFVAKTTSHSEASLRWLLPVLAVAQAVGLAPPLLQQDGSGRLAPGGVTLEPYLSGQSADTVTLHRIAPRLRRLHARLSRYPLRPIIARSTPPPTQHILALRRAQKGWAHRARTVIHGDVTPNNVLLTENGFSLIDWDEARVDYPSLDLPAPLQHRSIRDIRLRREVVFGWYAEPDYARRLARRLKARRAPGA
ncbi:MAG: phosphotransferase [Pseudomonadota bacterium]